MHVTDNKDDGFLLYEEVITTLIVICILQQTTHDDDDCVHLQAITIHRITKSADVRI